MRTKGVLYFIRSRENNQEVQPGVPIPENTVNSEAIIDGEVKKEDLDQEVQANLDDLGYNDVYIGVGASRADIMTDGNHHDTVSKFEQISVTVTNSYLWLILPDTYSPVVQMNGIDIPMTEQESVTSGEVTYKVLKSSNAYTGTFNVSLT